MSSPPDLTWSAALPYPGARGPLRFWPAGHGGEARLDLEAEGDGGGVAPDLVTELSDRLTSSHAWLAACCEVLAHRTGRR